ncbi:hypothetical protein EAN04_24650 [Salmonella enterica]|nr:hypothetical protein [Salmonella enterica]
MTSYFAHLYNVCVGTIVMDMFDALDWEDPDSERRVRAAADDVLKYFGFAGAGDMPIKAHLESVAGSDTATTPKEKLKPEQMMTMYLTMLCAARFRTAYAEPYELRDAALEAPKLYHQELLDIPVMPGDKPISLDGLFGLFADLRVAVQVAPSSADKIYERPRYDIPLAYLGNLPLGDPRRSAEPELRKKLRAVITSAMDEAQWARYLKECAVARNRYHEQKAGKARAKEEQRLAAIEAEYSQEEQQRRRARAEQRAAIVAEREAERLRQEADAAARLAEIQRQRELAASAPRELTEEEVLLQNRREITRVFLGNLR